MRPRLSILRSWANPIIRKELRGRMRGWRTFALLSFHVLVMGVFVSGFYGLAVSTQNSMHTRFSAPQLGQTLFVGLTCIEMILAAVITPAATASAISGERERQTLDMLRTTLLPGSAVVLGKLGVALLYMVLLLLAGLPLQSLAFLIGGVTPIEVGAAVGLMFVTALLFGAAGIFFSSLTRRTLASTILTYSFILLNSVGTLLLIFPLDAAKSALMYNYDSAYQPVVETFFIYANWALACLNPFWAGFVSAQVFSDYHAAFYYTIVTTNYGYTLPLFSPWLPFLLLALSLSAAFLAVSVWRFNRAER
jgi:ABC-type transport system involved in multi-copper enzyme maturation permease subunit